MSYPELVALMVKEFDSDARQLQVQSDLAVLRFGVFVAANNITADSAGLTAIVNEINHLVPQCPPEFRSQSNKMRFLRTAVRDVHWAYQPVSQLTTQKCTFNAFVTALRESLHLQTEIKSHRQVERSHVLDTFHGHYGRNPKDVRKHARTGRY